MTRKVFLFVFLLITTLVHAQESPFKQIKQLYDNFEYQKVIQNSEALITNPQISDSTRINIYILRAVSFYVLSNNDQVKNSFENILLIRKDYSPNNSPELNSTLINMFNGIKAEYLKRLKEEETKNNSSIILSQMIYNKQISYGSLFLKNIVLPGWGQLTTGKNRGILYSVAWLINIGALVYYIDDTNKKQDAYQREINLEKFDNLYSAYNKSYKIRNALWVSLPAIWIIDKLDLLLFHEEEIITSSDNTNSGLPYPGNQSDITLSFKIPLSF